MNSSGWPQKSLTGENEQALGFYLARYFFCYKSSAGLGFVLFSQTEKRKGHVPLANQLGIDQVLNWMMQPHFALTLKL